MLLNVKGLVSGRSRCAGALGSNPREDQEELLNGYAEEKDNVPQGTRNDNRHHPEFSTITKHKGTEWRSMRTTQSERG